MQFTNHCYTPEAQEQVFNIEIPYTQSPDNEQSSLDLTKKSRPSYATIEASVPEETQSNIPSMANNVDPMKQK